MSCWPILSLKYAKWMTSSTFEPERKFLSQGRSNNQFLANCFFILYLSGYSTLCLFDLVWSKIWLHKFKKYAKKTQNIYTFYTYPFQGHGAYLSCLGVSAEQHGHYPLTLTPSPYRQFWNSSYVKKKEALGQWGGGNKKEHVNFIEGLRSTRRCNPRNFLLWSNVVALTTEWLYKTL